MRIVAGLAALVLAGGAQAAEVCAIPQPPQVIAQSGDPHAKGSRLLQAWTMDDAPVWTIVAMLHNHAFHPGQPELNGAPAPSRPDAQFLVNFAGSGMAEAWITNGLHTAHIPAAAFGLFERDGP